MNYIDSIVLVVIGLYIFNGFRKGFVGILIDLVVFFGSIFIAVLFYQQFGNFIAIKFGVPTALIKTVGFVALWLLAQIVLSLVGTIIYYFLPAPVKNNSVNKMTGVIPALIQGVLLVGILLVLLISIPVLPEAIKNKIEEGALSGPISKNGLVLEQDLESKMGNKFSDSLAFFTIGNNWNKNQAAQSEESKTIRLPYKIGAVSVDENSENKMIDLVNVDRQKNGENVLKVDDKLTLLARDYGQKMLNEGFFGHISPDGTTPLTRAEASGVKFLVIGENLAFAPLVEVAHTGLMNSPTHRANILSKDYSRIGIGVIDGGKQGKIFVQEFAD